MRAQVKDIAGGTVPQCKAHLSTNQTVVSTTVTKLNIDTFDYNLGGFTLSSNQVAVPTTGLYIICAHYCYSVLNGGVRQTTIKINGAFQIAEREEFGSSSNYNQGMLGGFTHRLTARDLVGLYVYQDNGGSVSLLAGDSSTTPGCYLTLARVSL